MCERVANFSLFSEKLGPSFYQIWVVRDKYNSGYSCTKNASNSEKTCTSWKVSHRTKIHSVWERETEKKCNRTVAEKGGSAFPLEFITQIPLVINLCTKVALHLSPGLCLLLFSTGGGEQASLIKIEGTLARAGQDFPYPRSLAWKVGTSHRIQQASTKCGYR